MVFNIGIYRKLIHLQSKSMDAILHLNVDEISILESVFDIYDETMNDRTSSSSSDDEEEVIIFTLLQSDLDDNEIMRLARAMYQQLDITVTRPYQAHLLTNRCIG